MSEIARSENLNGGVRCELIQGDITRQRVDAIVNAANSRLKHGGGLAGAIVSAGGMEIQRQSDEWVRTHGAVSHAEPAYTQAGALPCRYVIHAVGPVWGAGEEDEKLAAAVRGSLALAERLELESMALPAISTGIFGFPMQRAAGVILGAIRAYFRPQSASTLKLVRVVLFDRASLETFIAAWEQP